MTAEQYYDEMIKRFDMIFDLFTGKTAGIAGPFGTDIGLTKEDYKQAAQRDFLARSLKADAEILKAQNELQELNGGKP